MCTSPIWIANRRYTRKDHDISLPMSNLAQNPWDVARFRLLVPCGQCEECLKALRNDWYVRIRQELARCRAEHCEAWFVTITIHPRYYRHALNDPTWFMRKWFERVRHVTGRSIKHVFFQEFGTHSQTGSEPRLHFHGFLFDPRMLYNDFRRIVARFGFVWLGQATPKRARYCVKYVVKQLNISGYELPDKLRLKLSDRRYTRNSSVPVLVIFSVLSLVLLFLLRYGLLMLIGKLAVISIGFLVTTINIYNRLKKNKKRFFLLVVTHFISAIIWCEIFLLSLLKGMPSIHHPYPLIKVRLHE